MIKKLAFGLLTTVAVAGMLNAATEGTDNASVEPPYETWNTGDDGSVTGPSAFGPWTFTDEGDNAGHFIGDSRSLNDSGTGGDINSTGNESWGMFGHTGHEASAARSFDSGLAVGQTFSIDIAVNFRSGFKGLDLRQGSTAIFNFNIASDDYVVQFAATGNGSIGSTYSETTAFRLSFTQTSASGGSWTIARSGGVTDLDSGTYTGVPDGFNLYIGDTVGGGLNENNLFANNLAIVPEPSSLSLLAGPAILGAWFYVRRRRRA